MIEFNQELREILGKTEWIAMVTSSPEAGPHLVAAWGYRFRKIGVRDGGVIVLPAGRYIQTEANLNEDPRIQLLVASGDVQGPDGNRGQGYRLSGRGEVQTQGAMAELIRRDFLWARGALVIGIEKAEALIA